MLPGVEAVAGTAGSLGRMLADVGAMGRRPVRGEDVGPTAGQGSVPLLADPSSRPAASNAWASAGAMEEAAGEGVSADGGADMPLAMSRMRRAAPTMGWPGLGGGRPREWEQSVDGALNQPEKEGETCGETQSLSKVIPSDR